MKHFDIAIGTVLVTLTIGSILYFTRDEDGSDREFRRVIGIPLPDRAKVKTVHAKESGFDVSLIQEITNLPSTFSTQVCTLLPTRRGATLLEVASGSRAQRGSQCSFRISVDGVRAEILVHENSIVLSSN